MSDTHDPLAHLSPQKRALFELLSKSKRQAAPVVPRRPPAPTAPLSFAQERLWFLDRLEPGNPAYNLALAFRVEGGIDADWARRALEMLVARHETLRTTIGAVDGVPVQVVAGTATPRFDRIDLTATPATEQDAELQRVATAAFEQPFDLAAGPLLRTTLIRLAPARHVLLFVMHHIVSDGWSMERLAREFFACAAAVAQGRDPDLPPLAVQYADYAAWQRHWFQGDVRQRQLEYWIDRLAGVPPLDLPTDFPRPPVQTFRGRTRAFVFEAGLTARLKAFARRHDATLFMTLLAGFAILLARCSGQDDVAIGSPIAGRTHRETEDVIGLFANTLVMRCRLEGCLTPLDVLARVREVVLGAHEHQDLPFEQIVDALKPVRDLARNPLFQVMFILLKPSADEAIEQVALSAGLSKFDLTLTLHEQGDRLTGQLEYCTDLFAESTAARLSRYLTTVLSAMADAPEAPLESVPLLDRDERARMLHEWNGTAMPYRTDGGLACRLAEAARERPDHPALVTPGGAVTFREIDERSARLATYLTGLGVGPDVPIGVCLERSADLVVALTAVLRAGGAYVPLDPAFPAARLAPMIGDARMPLLLTDGRRPLEVPAFCRRVDLVAERAAWMAMPPQPAPLPVDADQLAYIIYTSGSTGRPKGVQISHRSVLNFLASMRRTPGLDAGDRLLAVTTLSFDIAGLEVWLPLTTGATVVLAGADAMADGRALARLIEAERVTVMQATPVTWRLLQEAGWTNPHGIRVLVGGEALPQDLASYLKRVSRSVWNMYGPTETTVWSAVEPVAEVDGPVPIGRPIGNTRLYVLDARFEPLPPGVVGDLYIGGDGLARGYLGQPDTTADRFVPDPHAGEPGARMYRTGDRAAFREDGRVVFAGRSDQQVKLRGFRIELGDVEAALARHAGVRQVAAIVREDLPGDRRLVGYVVPQPGVPLTGQALRESVRETLPGYMIPSAIVLMDALPLTPNAKIDRRALPKPEAVVGERAGVTPPRDEDERRMAAIWSEVLGADIGSVHDDFFESGGHSMLAARLLSAVGRRFGVDVPLRVLFEAPTVAQLARAVRLLAAGVPPGTQAADPRLLIAEAVLDADIVPPADAAASPPSRIFLTGATGFLGTYLLSALLDATGADVVCLVRAGSPEAGVDRLRGALEAFRLWKPEYAPRIAAQPGDLGQPRLGLSEQAFDALGDRVEAIYHNGALVNFAHPYKALKRANVLGTMDVLRLACRRRTKPVHYVSTMDMLGAAYYTTGERDGQPPPEGLATGYAESKWVAERLVHLARQRGLPAAVYRPARIVGDSRTGMWNTDDFASRAIKGLIQLGAAPAVHPIDNMSPVDYVSRAIVRLSRSPVSRDLPAFHVINPQWFQWDRMFEFIRARGYPLAQVPYRAWHQRLVEACRAGDDNALKPLLPLFPVPPEAGQDPAVEMPPPVEPPRARCEVTAEALDGTGVECPAIDGALLSRYFDYFVRTGFLASATTAGEPARP
ncbi:MAG TPA: amino acid adenylation domain-containing protein [Vicinamibacterales bacterium]|nr:amino acid adenylation domain-containing protein [Vicinamibacterales bacterium]